MRMMACTWRFCKARPSSMFSLKPVELCLPTLTCRAEMALYGEQWPQVHLNPPDSNTLLDNSALVLVAKTGGIRPQGWEPQVSQAGRQAGPCGGLFRGTCLVVKACCPCSGGGMAHPNRWRMVACGLLRPFKKHVLRAAGGHRWEPSSWALRRVCLVARRALQHLYLMRTTGSIIGCIVCHACRSLWWLGSSMVPRRPRRCPIPRRRALLSPSPSE